MLTPRASTPSELPSSRQRARADRRLPSALLGLLGIVMVTTGLAWTFLGLSMRSLESVLHDRVEALALLHTVNDEMQHLMADMAIKADRGVVPLDSASATARGAGERASASWNLYMDTWFTPEEAELVERIMPAIDRGFLQSRLLADTLARGDREALSRFLDGSFFPDLDRFSSSLRELVALQVRVTQDAHALSRARFDVAGRAFIGAVIAAMALVIVALLAASRRTPHATRRWGH